MRLLVVGSRSILEFNLSLYIPEETAAIISSGACGIDNLAEQYADIMHISKFVLLPNYKLYGRAAPLLRNKEMVEMSDAVLAVWDGKSRGTMFTIEYARKQGKPINIVAVNS